MKMLKALIETYIGTYITLGLEEDWARRNLPEIHSKKPNMIYRIYKRFNKKFRLEAEEYIYGTSVEKYFDDNKYRLHPILRSLLDNYDEEES